MTYKNPLNAYQHASETVNEMKQVIMLYEGAINFIEQAKVAIDERNYEKRYNLINRAIAIVTGLNSCLDFNDKTNDTAKALDEYYQSIDMRLLYINTNDSIADCDGVIEDLKIMLNAWRDIADGKTTGNNEDSQKDLKPETSANASGELDFLKDVQITV